MKKTFYFITIIAMLFLCNCSKKCECIMHNSDGYPTPDNDPVIESMPYGLHLDCSFFDDFVDTLGGFKCK